MMKQRESLPEVLQQLNDKGYQLAEHYLTTYPEESILANDWRLDTVRQVHDETNWGTRSMVVAVSSILRHMKLVFVQALRSQMDYSPMAILKRLFPVRK